MSKVQDIYDRAVAKFGKKNVGDMCNVCGGWDGTVGTVPQSRHGDLIDVLNRMMGSGQAVARAQADFKTLDEAKEKAKREPSKPQTLDTAAIYRKWNASTATAE